jgi:hypothetical protein
MIFAASGGGSILFLNQSLCRADSGGHYVSSRWVEKSFFGLCPPSKKSLLFESSWKHYSVGCSHLDNRKMRANRKPYPTTVKFYNA